MAKNIRKIWVASYDVMVKNPIVLLPFVFIAFLETLALEIIYFFPRKPLSFIFNPIVKKFFGEAFIHYPGNIVILPRIFYFAHVFIYAFFGVCLMAVSVNICKNVRLGHSIKFDSLFSNATKRYISFLAYGLLIANLVILLGRVDQVLLLAIPKLISVNIMFLLNVVLYTFFICTIPLMVVKNRHIIRALGGSIILGFRRFFSLFFLILFPFLIFLPIAILKTYSFRLVEKTFPEVSILVTLAGVIISVFLDCFIILSATNYIMENDEELSAKLK